MAQLTTALVWRELEKNLFAVLGMVTAKQEARTVGIVYVVHERKIYIGTRKDSWKEKHITRNPHVSLTVPIARSVPLMPWIKVPAATITCAGEATVTPASAVAPEILRAVYHQLIEDPTVMAESSVITVTPLGEFVTYGVGVSLMEMRHPDKARGRVVVD
jgi:hypothetical protein